MNRIINLTLKVLFFVIFFVIVTPFGVLLRLGGIDYLDRRFDNKKKSYWIEKDK